MSDSGRPRRGWYGDDGEPTKEELRQQLDAALEREKQLRVSHDFSCRLNWDTSESATCTCKASITDLQQQLAAALEREKLLQECVDLYAYKDNWGCSATNSRDHDCDSEPEKCCWDEWQGPIGVHGFVIAQECKRKVEGGDV